MFDKSYLRKNVKANLPIFFDFLREKVATFFKDIIYKVPVAFVIVRNRFYFVIILVSIPIGHALCGVHP